MKPQLIDILNYAKTLRAKAKKDELRIKLFVVALEAKAAQFVVTGLDSVSVEQRLNFTMDSADLVWRWVSLPSKLSLASLFSDPYGKLREDVRKFAKRWDLDPEFIKEMG